MTAAVSAANNPLHRLDSPAEGDRASTQLLNELIACSATAETELELLEQTADTLDRHLKLLALFYFRRCDHGEVGDPIQLRPATDDPRSGKWERQIANACRIGCKNGSTCVQQQSLPAQTIVAAPMMRPQGADAALGIAYGSNQQTEKLILVTQLFASHILLWRSECRCGESEQDARISTALAELLNRVLTTENLNAACSTLVSELSTHFEGNRVAVGLCKGAKRNCRLVALSGTSQIDKRSSLVQATEAAMEETLLREQLSVWPATADHPQHALLAHKHLCALTDTNSVVSAPLRDNQRNQVGVLTVFEESDTDSAATIQFLGAAEGSLATTLSTAGKIHAGAIARSMRGAGRFFSGIKGKLATAALLLAVAVMWIPWQYTVRCDCQIEPVVRRFVVAPFEGALEKSLVKPGEIVSQGDAVARMDGRELRWERAGLIADQKSATKKRDSAQASHDYAEQQIAQLEIERLELQLKLLDHRTDNLEIKSPIKGIVVSGDLERAEGAPLQVGQTLFEVAPLQKMIVQIAVPDDEIAYVQPGQQLDLRLDAYPDRTWSSLIAKLQPRSEIRDDRNVFIAEAELDNRDAQLLPGMRGRSKIQTHECTLGWLLFHKSWEYLTKKVGW